MYMDVSSIALIAGISTFQVIDLTHLITENVRVWDYSCGFNSKLTGDYDKGGFRGHEYIMRSCLGTHMDSPAHCIKGGADCSTLDIKNCIVPAYVIHIEQKAHEDYCISKEDILDFEKNHGIIKEGSLVFFNTGWAKRWNDPAKFRNEKNDGIPHFPYLSEQAAQLLLERSIVGIGVDTFSPDAFYVPPVVHKLLLGAGKYIIENVANLEAMPPINAFVIALPLKIEEGAESPIRLIGLVAK